jgi:hypothetical protein
MSMWYNETADTIDEPKKHPKEIFYAYISG